MIVLVSPILSPCNSNAYLFVVLLSVCVFRSLANTTNFLKRCRSNRSILKQKNNNAIENIGFKIYKTDNKITKEKICATLILFRGRPKHNCAAMFSTIAFIVFRNNSSRSAKYIKNWVHSVSTSSSSPFCSLCRFQPPFRWRAPVSHLPAHAAKSKALNFLWPLLRAAKNKNTQLS